MILYVDDEDRYTVNYRLELQFALPQYDLLYLDNVDEALKVFKENMERVELLILDIMMPPGQSFKDEDTMQGLRTGVLFYRFVRKFRPALTVIISTNVSDPELEDYFVKEKRCLFLRKDRYFPFEFAEEVKKAMEEF